MTPAPAPAPTTPTAVERAIRTAISAAVGFVAVFCLTHFGWHISGAGEGAAIGALTAGAMTLYNAFALWAEKKWSWARFLLLGVGN
jgi:ABC-type Fe3+-siderophore transport system permease subunit